MDASQEAQWSLEGSAVAGSSSSDRPSWRLGAKRLYAFLCPSGQGGGVLAVGEAKRGVGAICEEVKRREDK